jgi:uncharacterized membrane protein YhaH (DUF805 family)
MIYIDTIKRTFDFRGRSSRKEFWTFFVITVIVGVYISISIDVDPVKIGYVISLTSLSLSVRRLHDISQSGLLLLVPIGLGLVLRLLPEVDEMTNSDSTIGDWRMILSIFYWLVNVFFIGLFSIESHGDNKYGKSSI